ncbi:hypothetical protein [Streptomyces lunalinharesii]
MTADQAVRDPQLTDDARDLMQRLARLGPLYDYELPMAAISLDMAIDLGKLGLITGNNEGSLLSLNDLAGQLGVNGTSDVRTSLHRLHSIGALLVELHDDTPLVRVVANRPSKPGDPWIFQGTPESANVPSVCIPEQARELSAEQISTLMYMRACQSQMEQPDPEKYGRFEGINGPDHARELFNSVKATGLLDYHGCDACPAGHLCTRKTRR